VSLARIDARFLLPEPLATAYASEPEWLAPLAESGVQVVAGSEVAQAAFGRRRSAKALVEGDPDSVVLEGMGAERFLRRRGYHVRDYVALPDPARPALLLPLAERAPVAYAIRTRMMPRSRLKRARKHLVAALLAHGVPPSPRHVVTVGLRDLRAPFLVDAAGALGVAPASSWFLLNGSGDALARGIFFLFPPGADEPHWSLKFSRVANYRDPFDRDARGLALANDAGRTVAEHAPALVGRFEVAGTYASLETAACGSRLDDLLLGPGPRDAKLGSIERVAAWTLEMARATAAPEERLADERVRLNALTDELEPSLPAVRGLADALPTLRPVFQHNDLGPWNIVTRGEGFTAVDWESARRFGLPLWDLWYFLVGALPLVERIEPGEVGRFVVRLFRGEASTSPVLFRWTRRTVEALGVPPESVGRIAGLCWLHHSRSHLAREAALSQFAPGASRLRLITEEMPSLWFSEPGLGTEWRRWSE
jgi:hypothetical protein